MKNKKVLISITDRHESGGEDSGAELITVGTLRGWGDNYLIKYTEQDSSMKNSVTTLKVENKSRIIMTRTGEFSTELIIEQDKRHNCHYQTPYGELMMGVFARSVHSKMNPDGGELRFLYTIDFNSGLASVNELKVTVKEVKDHVPLS